jgi:prolyl-tRNA synthetase
MIQQVSSGVYSYLPLGWRSLKKIETIIREEMDKVASQEIKLGILQPRDLWQQSGRDEIYGPDMLRLKDRKDRDLVLPPTNEELVTLTVKNIVQSYRDLPISVYQIQTKFRDEPRPRGGLIRVREFDMMDAYTFDIDESGLDRNYNLMIQAFQNSFARCGLDTVLVDADSGAIGGKDSKEFILVSSSGEDTIILCDQCDYAANDEKATFNKQVEISISSSSIEKFKTINMKTIESLSKNLDVQKSEILKTVFYMSDNELIIVATRGDLDISEVKLKNHLKCNELRLANSNEVIEKGFTPGFASPVNVDSKTIQIICDDSLKFTNNLIAGANENDYHFKNVQYSRDFTSNNELDITIAKEGFVCPKCPGILQTKRGIEIGHVFKLGTGYSESLSASYSDSKGISNPLVMGCYGIGIGRILAGAIEQRSNDKQMVLPKNIAPYQVLILGLNSDNTDTKSAANELYQNLLANGIDVAYDDRDESPGVKFNDAELMGIPMQIIVSSRNLKNNSFEIKIMTHDDNIMVGIPGSISEINKILKDIN